MEYLGTTQLIWVAAVAFCAGGLVIFFLCSVNSYLFLEGLTRFKLVVRERKAKRDAIIKRIRDNALASRLEAPEKPPISAMDPSQIARAVKHMAK